MSDCGTFFKVRIRPFILRVRDAELVTKLTDALSAFYAAMRRPQHIRPLQHNWAMLPRLSIFNKAPWECAKSRALPCNKPRVAPCAPAKAERAVNLRAADFEMSLKA